MISNKAKLLFLILENYVNTELKFETYMATVEPRSTVSLSTNDQVTITAGQNTGRIIYFLTIKIKAQGRAIIGNGAVMPRV